MPKKSYRDTRPISSSPASGVIWSSGHTHSTPHTSAHWSKGSKSKGQRKTPPCTMPRPGTNLSPIPSQAPPVAMLTHGPLVRTRLVGFATARMRAHGPHVHTQHASPCRERCSFTQRLACFNASARPGTWRMNLMRGHKRRRRADKKQPEHHPPSVLLSTTLLPSGNTTWPAL